MWVSVFIETSCTSAYFLHWSRDSKYQLQVHFHILFLSYDYAPSSQLMHGCAFFFCFSVTHSRNGFPKTHTRSNSGRLPLSFLLHNSFKISKNRSSSKSQTSFLAMPSRFMFRPQGARHSARAPTSVIPLTLRNNLSSELNTGGGAPVLPAMMSHSRHFSAIPSALSSVRLLLGKS